MTIGLSKRPVSGVRSIALGVVLTAGSSAMAWAGGFYAPYQSGTANATAIAGATAGTGDASGLFFNPAANAGATSREILIDLKAAFPDISIQASSSTAPPPIAGPGIPTTGNSNTGSLAGDQFAPNVFVSLPLNEQLAFGLAVSGPFAARVDADPTWAGRFHLTKTEITTYNGTASLAWQATDWLAVGAGLSVQYFDGVFERNEIGPLPSPPFPPGSFVEAGTGFLEGDDIQVGFNAGLILTPFDGTRIGVAYRSEMAHDFNGTAGLRNTPASVTSAQYELTMPQVVSVGLHQQLTEKLTLLAEAQWVDFSAFTGFDITLGAPPFRDVRPQDWDDTFIFALGFAYAHDEKTTFRAGIHYDTAVSDGGGNVLSPDADRIMVGFGVEREISEKVTLSAHYAHVFFDDAEISVTDPVQGTLVGVMESNLHLGGLAINIRW